MKTFIVCRSFVTRLRWTIEAKDEQDAINAMDDENRTPIMAADEEWIGPIWGTSLDEQEDNVIEISDCPKPLKSKSKKKQARRISK